MTIHVPHDDDDASAAAHPSLHLEVAAREVIVLREGAAWEASVVDATLGMTLKVSVREDLTDALAILRQATCPDLVAHRATPKQVQTWIEGRLGTQAGAAPTAGPREGEALSRAVGDITVLRNRLRRRPVAALRTALAAGMASQREQVHLDQVARLESLTARGYTVPWTNRSRRSMGHAWTFHGRGNQLEVDDYVAEVLRRW